MSFVLGRRNMRQRKTKRPNKEGVSSLHASHHHHLGAMIENLVLKTGLYYGTTYRVHWFANIASFCFLTTYILQIIALFTANGDPERLFECFSVLSFCGMGVLKLNSLRRNHEIWRFLLKQISTLENEQLKDTNIYQSDGDVNFVDSINDYTKNFVKMSKILTRIYGFTAVVFILSPFIEHLWKLLSIEPVGYPHVLPIWPPLEDFSIGYAVTVICEVIAAVYCVCVHTAFDLTSVGVIIFVCGQFSLLRKCSERIGGDAEVCCRSNERDKQAHYRIIHCHRTHLCLVNSTRMLDKVLKGILGVYFFVATLTLCSVAIRISSEAMSLMQLMSLVQYMCGTLTQLFLFCRYGDEVLNKSSVGMGQGPFGTAFWNLSPGIRKELVLLSAGMMRPQRLHAGPFNSLDLPSFIQVMRAAYSYYAVLGNNK